jgi:exosome complex exonuclease RRP6
MRVFAALFAWRDRTAREQDESTRYVLPNHMLFRISELMPADQDNLIACCSPVPPLVKVYATDLLAIIVEAKKEVCCNICAYANM